VFYFYVFKYKIKLGPWTIPFMYQYTLRELLGIEIGPWTIPFMYQYTLRELLGIEIEPCTNPSKLGIP
jgi:hypothetical protein